MTFEDVMDNFRKKVLQTDFERKKACKYIPGRKISCTEKISLMIYNAEKKSYTVICRRKIF